MRSSTVLPDFEKCQPRSKSSACLIDTRTLERNDVAMSRMLLIHRKTLLAMATEVWGSLSLELRFDTL